MNNLGKGEQRGKITQYVRLNAFALFNLPEKGGVTCLDPIEVGTLNEQ